MSKFALFTKPEEAVPGPGPEPVPPATDGTHFLVLYSLDTDEYTSAGGSAWDIARDSTSGISIDSSTNYEGAIRTRCTSGGDYIIARSHFEFDLSVLDTTSSRDFISITFDVAGYGWDTGQAMIQESTFTPGDWQNNFQQFTGPDFLDSYVPWYEYVAPDTHNYRNLMPLNTAGMNYIISRLGSDSAKLCAREYHDHANIPPAISTIYNSGCFYREANTIGLSARIVTPRLLLLYTKPYNWTSHVNDTDWGADGATWDGSQWTTGGGGYIWMYPNGWETGYTGKTCGMRITFTGVDTLYMYLYNTESWSYEALEDYPITSGEIIEYNGRPSSIGGVEDYCNYNNYDIAEMDLYSGPGGSNAGDFTITNIEFLNP